MDLEHTFTVGSSLEETWAAFNDLERVAPCFPGATLTSVDGDEFRGSVKVKLGPIALQYNGTGKFVERDEGSRHAVIEARGRDKRGNGTAAATVRAQFSPDGAGTRVEVVTDLAITGKPAQFGRGVIQDVSDKLLGQFVACLQDKLGGDTAADAVDASGEGTSPAAGDGGAPAAAGDGGAPATAGGGATSAAASGHSAAAGGGGAAGRAGSAASAPPLAAAEAPDAELDLWSTIAPVLAKRYAPLVGAALGGLLLGLLLGRRRRHRGPSAG